MTEISLEELVEEQEFVDILLKHAEVFFRLSNTLLDHGWPTWNKRHYFQLINETDALETVLDDYGARYNRTFGFLTELVASLRWFAQTGFSISHYLRRLDAYAADAGGFGLEVSDALASADRAAACARSGAAKLLEAIRIEARRLGLDITSETQPESDFVPVVARQRLPRNVGQTDLVDEKQKIAEVASKYIQACEMLTEIGIRRIEDPELRAKFLTENYTEERARVCEAKVHNLQSTYDTHIGNTVLEAQDDRLPAIRGHISASLHLLEAVTYLTHFVERHEDEVRRATGKDRISKLIQRTSIQEAILNELLIWANQILQAGAEIAHALLPSYMDVRSMEVQLPEGVTLHARPVALIVGIVNRYGTPVELEINGTVANAGSILKMLMVVGSNPDERRFLFRGDERPLRDIQLLFEASLGEQGIDALPPELSYLQER